MKIDTTEDEAAAALALAPYVGPLESFETLDVTDDATLALAAGGIDWLKKQWKEAEALRQWMVKPINEAHDRIQALFKPRLDRYKAAEKSLKKKVLALQDRRRVENQAKMLHNAAAVQTGGPMVVAFAATELPANLQRRELLAFEVTDLAALPLEYHQPDHGKIGDEGRRQAALGLEPEIPGVRFFREAHLAAVGNG